MALAQQKHMTPEEFLEWHVKQAERYEFVDGAPQLKFVSFEGAKMMVGATNAHGVVAINVGAELKRLLRGRSCRTIVADGKIRIPNGNFRYADVAVDCGPFDPKATFLAEPVLAVEILSKSTRWLDLTKKLEDYKSVAAIRHILFLSQDEPAGQMWTRAGEWRLDEFSGLDAAVPVEALSLSLAFAALYEGVAFES